MKKTLISVPASEFSSVNLTVLNALKTLDAVVAVKHTIKNGESRMRVGFIEGAAVAASGEVYFDVKDSEKGFRRVPMGSVTQLTFIV